LSTIPASCYISHFEEAEQWLVKDQNNNPIGYIDKARLDLLWRAGNDASKGTGSKSRLRFITMLIPMDTALSMGRQARVTGKVDEVKEKELDRIPGALPHIEQERIGGGLVYSHVAHRCSAAQPYMEPVNGAWM
jgi:hypothetical protein